MIRTVIFDIDDTLYDFPTAEQLGRRTIRDYAARECGVDGDIFLNCFIEMMREQARLHLDSAGCHSRCIRAQMTCEKLHIPLRHAPVINDLFWNSFIDSIIPFDGIPELFAALKERGIRIGICSNMTADWQLKKLVKLGLADLCDFVVTSEEAAAEKPQKEIFELCLQKAGCAPEECLFIGDNPEFDYIGSTNAGMKALWLCIKPEKRAKYPDFDFVFSPAEIFDHIKDQLA